ncbi:hypothetical protein ACWGE0_26360 [Lentzea sp. NPDC054927]
MRTAGGVRSFRLPIMLLLTGLLALFGAQTAAAHGISNTADVQLAQSFAGNELTIVLRRTEIVPGPLVVDVVAHDPVRPVEITLTATAVESPDPAPNTGSVRLGNKPGVYTTRLRVDRAGPWELELRTGDERAVLPFRVMVPTSAVWEKVSFPAFALAGVLLALALLAAATRRRSLGVAGGLAAVVTLTVALTAALLSPSMLPAVPEGAPPTVQNRPEDGFAAGGRPYLNQALTTSPAQPLVGQEFTLTLALADGATGRPADDLVSHHAALAHTVITSADCVFFRHLHPVRRGPGVLELRLTVDRPGRYLVNTELERADSGGQLVTGSFQVTGDAQPEPPAPQDDTETVLRLDPGKPVAGQPTGIELEVRAGGRPVRDLQPWLGMAGHLVVRDTRSDLFGHVHERDSMAAQSVPGARLPDDTVAQYGPVLRFAFTFPTAGRYPVWIQYMRGFRVHTVPLFVDVAPEER